ncbi:MAG: hypothetical protein ACUVQT_03860 [bacterium]
MAGIEEDVGIIMLRGLGFFYAGKVGQNGGFKMNERVKNMKNNNCSLHFVSGINRIFFNGCRLKC